MAQYVTLAGNELTMPEPFPESVLETRKVIAKVLSLRSTEQVMLLVAGTAIEDSDTLPREGLVQVTTRAPPEGTWARVIWDANALDEHVLCAALDDAFPAPLGELVIPAEHDASIDWRPQSFWSPEEAWAQWCSKQMELATVSAVGKWANFWKFGRKADTYGYWMVKPPFRNKEKTVNQVVSDVKHWSTLLHDLDATFHDIQERTQGMNPAESLEMAAAQLLKYSPSFEVNTSFKYGFETWYSPFERTLRWYADFAGMDAGVGHEIATVVSGVFSSYSVKPDGAKQFAERMAKHFNVSIEDFNATEKWKLHRPTLIPTLTKGKNGGYSDRNELGNKSKRKSPIQVAHSNVEHIAPCDEDAHFDFICSTDDARSTERAERMKRALFSSRSAARSGLGLSLDRLKDWSNIIVGSASVRRADAYAKRGRERYPFTETLSEDIETFLKDAEDRSIQPHVRAARVYLDICFYHPFDDGNGRLARLGLDFILAKNRLCLKDVGGLFSLSRSADDGPGAQAFVDAIQQRLAPRGKAADSALEAWSKLPSTTLQEKQLERPADVRKAYRWFDCLTSELDLGE